MNAHVMPFKSAAKYGYRSGDLFLGFNTELGARQNPIGVTTERHAITFAGARSGKGATVIIPNLKLWPHNALVIDPKGEAVEETFQDRERLGQTVRILDPFKKTKNAQHLRASFNPLHDLDPQSLTIKEDIATIADGIIMRANPESEHWDSGAGRIISGLIAYVLLALPKERQNLLEVRRIIRNEQAFSEAIDAMKNMDGCAGLCEAGASAAYAKEGGYFVSNAEKNTEWLDSQAMQECLSSSSFSMDELKNGKTSVYLVLPANYLRQHGRFLRLFVRYGIEAMARDTPSGNLKGERCLFFLDEFFSLGYIDEIATSAGLMPGYGLHMWPILQDLGQLIKLYGREGADTFFANSDVHQFFAATDATTLDYISGRIGVYTPDDLPPEPHYKDDPTNHQRQSGQHMSRADLGQQLGAHDWKIYTEKFEQYNRDASRILGKARMSPDEVAFLIRKESGTLAEASIVFVHGMQPLLLKPKGYWEIESFTSSGVAQIADDELDLILDNLNTAPVTSRPLKERLVGAIEAVEDWYYNGTWNDVVWRIRQTVIRWVKIACAIVLGFFALLWLIVYLGG